MKFLIFIMCCAVLIGCGSTPKRDDHVKHVNTLKQIMIAGEDYTLSLANGDKVDLRGVFDRNDTAGNSNILYQGGGGIIGLVAQIGVHTAMVNASRDGKLSQQQEAANSLIRSLIENCKQISLNSLIDESYRPAFQSSSLKQKTLFLTPIFYSNETMDEIYVKLISWIPGAGKSNKFEYQNIVQVFAKKLTSEDEIRGLGDPEILEKTLHKIFNKSLDILIADLKGNFDQTAAVQSTFLIPQDDRNKVVRGVLASQDDDYKVIRNIHSWYIAIPN